MKNIVIVFVILLIFSCNKKEDTTLRENFYFTGRAYDWVTNEPIANVKIEITFHIVPPGILSSTKEVITNTTTDANGFYKVKPVTDFKKQYQYYLYYTFRVQAPNYYYTNRDFSINYKSLDTLPSQENLIDIPLTKPGYLKVNISASDTITSSHELGMFFYSSNDIIGDENGTFIYSNPPIGDEVGDTQPFKGKLNASLVYKVLGHDTVRILYKVRSDIIWGPTKEVNIFCPMNDTTAINIRY